jgi:excisionase family DNA binding protein
MAADLYLTAAQVAEIVQVDQKTILRWSLEDASMPVLRRGRVVRFRRERLLVWLERQEPRRRRKDGAKQLETAPSS